MDKNLLANCRGHRFDPWSGKIPYAAEERSPCSTNTEPLGCNYQAHVLQLLNLMHLQLVLCNKRRKARKKKCFKKTLYNRFLLNIIFLSLSPNLPLPPRKPQTLFFCWYLKPTGYLAPNLGDSLLGASMCTCSCS